MNLLKKEEFQEVMLWLLEFANWSGSLKTAYRWVQVGDLNQSSFKAGKTKDLDQTVLAPIFPLILPHGRIFKQQKSQILGALGWINFSISVLADRVWWNHFFGWRVLFAGGEEILGRHHGSKCLSLFNPLGSVCAFGPNWMAFGIWTPSHFPHFFVQLPRGFGSFT